MTQLPASSFSQRDPRWRSDILGTDPRHTIGSAGCLITAAASILVDFGVPTDPHRLNLWLRDHNGYALGCLLRFYSLAGLGADVKLLIRKPAPAAAADIRRALADNHAVIVELHPPSADPDLRHWVRITAAHDTPRRSSHGETDWQIMDPWRLPGNELVPLRAAYPEAILLSIVTYAHNPARVLRLTDAAPGPTQNPLRPIHVTPDHVAGWDPNLEGK